MNSNIDIDLVLNTVDDVINVHTFAKALEFEETMGDMFLCYTQTIVNDQLINNYVYCHQYIYKYCTITCLWKQLETDFLILEIIKWYKQQFQILTRTTKEKELDHLIDISAKLKKVLKYKFIESVVKLLKSSIADDSFFNKLDRTCPDWLPIKGCNVINLQTGVVRHRSITDYFSWECNVEPVKTINQDFLKIIKSIMCDDSENLGYFQKMMGYCLTGSKEAQSYFIWYGKGSNGKSLILNMMKAVLGNACDPVAKSVLIDIGKKSNNGPEVISLKDLRLGTFSESSAQEALNESMLKMLSGGDKIKARGLYKDEISFELFLKLIICTNHKPEFNGADFGTVRRIKFLPFEAKFTKTPVRKNEYPIIENLEQILIRDYLNDFFTFCLQGAHAWYNDKTFQEVPQGVKQQQDTYIKEQNTFGSWYAERIVACEGGRLNRASAYINYTSYCNESGVKALIKKEFLQKMTEECGKEVKYNGDMSYKNFELKEDNDDDCDTGGRKHDLDM